MDSCLVMWQRRMILVSVKLSRIPFQILAVYLGNRKLACNVRMFIHLVYVGFFKSVT